MTRTTTFFFADLTKLCICLSVYKSIYLSFPNFQKSVNEIFTGTEARLVPVRCNVDTKQMYMCALSVLFCLAENHFSRVRVELRRVKFLHSKYLFTKIVYSILLFVVSWQRTAPGRESGPPSHGWTCSPSCQVGLL